MSETVKAAIVGSIIIGIFMLISVKMVTNKAWKAARTAKAYIEIQKQELKPIVKREKAKAKELAIETAQIMAEEK